MPRAGLSTERVTDEAAMLADVVGLDHVTVSALAERLGVRQPSLYKHIDSIASLKRSVSIQAKRDLGDVLVRAAVGRSGPEAIRAMSHAYRRWALVHPGRYQASQLIPEPGDIENEAVMLSAIQIIADVLVAYQLEGDDAVDAIRGFRSILHGFVTLECAGGFTLVADVDRSFERLINGFIVALAQWTEQEQS